MPLMRFLQSRLAPGARGSKSIGVLGHVGTTSADPQVASHASLFEMKVLNDGWILDTTCYEWKHVQFKTQSQELKARCPACKGPLQGSYWKRMCGKILEHPYVAAQAELLAGPRRNSTGGRRLSAVAQTARSAVSGLNFETLAVAASKAVVGSNMSIGGVSLQGTLLGGTFQAATLQDPPEDQAKVEMRWAPQALCQEILEEVPRKADAKHVRPQAVLATAHFVEVCSRQGEIRRERQPKEVAAHPEGDVSLPWIADPHTLKLQDRAGMVNTEEEQFHEDLLAMAA
ncbi:ODA11 [Symbiodinium natans]|uniref:ODA11 protein n=1 Tax=Symbiodinium natans TaxID=878477 RepID=A0A812NQX5_9DINO|nr:ODA11 [Symbiodinium natans]